MEMVNSFKRYLRAIVPKIVIKSAREAEKYETEQSRLAGDEYIGARLQTDSWLMIRSEALSDKVLNAVGIYDKELISKIKADSFLIPEDKRDKVVELRRKEIIENYVEQNNYYRMLAGLPDIGADNIYIDPDDLAEYGYTKDKKEDYENGDISKLTPVHLLPQSVLNAMDSSGYLQELYDSYVEDRVYNPEYIKYMGYRKIDILQSRTAGHFELLYVPRPDNANRFNRDFNLYYEEARQYFLNQLYNFNYSFTYDYYEAYMGFFILNMAIQRMVDSMFEVMIERDFYDLETCRMFLDAYGVPWVDMLTLHQQKTLVKNLNILIMEKCTSQVLYDILGLIEYDNYDLTKYLLVKQHKTAQLNDEEEPRPIFIYRTILDEEGNASYELDKSMTYDYYFVGVPMNETDIKLAQITDANSHSYDEVTVPDELWYEDRELVQKLQDAEINYVETKYTNIAVTLRMQEVMFEHIYLQKMLCDKGNETSKIKLDVSLISPTPVSLLELEVMLICMMCKYNHMKPNLLTSPSQSLAVLGFNFDADLEAIKAEITSKEGKRIYSQKLVNYIKDIQFRTASDVNEMYNNVKMLHKLLVETMQTTASEVVYHAHKKLYMALFITDVHNEVFKLSDGSIPTTYMDWLKENDFYMYSYIDELDSEACVDKINYITTKMSTMFADTEYLKYLNPIDMTVMNGIIRLLRWFKSYTIEIKEMEVVYLFDSKYYNLMKMMSRMWFHQHEVVRELDIGYHEWVQSCTQLLMNKEFRGKFFDILRVSEHMSYKEMTGLMYDAFHLYANLSLRDYMSGWFSDILVCFEGSGYMEFSEYASILSESTKAYDNIYINEQHEDTTLAKDAMIRLGDGTMVTRDIMNRDYADHILIGTKSAKFTESGKLIESINSSTANYGLSDIMKLSDKPVRTENGTMKLRDYIIQRYADTVVSQLASIVCRDRMHMRDRLEFIIHDS